MEAAETRTFYRVLEGSMATERDFMSKAALGEPLRLPHTPKRRRMYAGGPITFEQTGIDPQHFTVWGTPAKMLELVLSPIEVERQISDL